MHFSTGHLLRHEHLPDLPPLQFQYHPIGLSTLLSPGDDHSYLYHSVELKMTDSLTAGAMKDVRYCILDLLVEQQTTKGPTQS